MDNKVVRDLIEKASENKKYEFGEQFQEEAGKVLNDKKVEYNESDALTDGLRRITN